MLKLLKIYKTTQRLLFLLWSFCYFVQQKSQCIELVRSNKKSENKLNLLC